MGEVETAIRAALNGAAATPTEPKAVIPLKAPVPKAEPAPKLGDGIVTRLDRIEAKLEQLLAIWR